MRKLVGLGFAFLAVGLAAGEELVRNGDFEIGDKLPTDWAPTGQ